MKADYIRVIGYPIVINGVGDTVFGITTPFNDGFS